MSDWKAFWQAWLNRLMWAVIFGAVTFAAMKYSGAYEEIKQGVMKVLHDVHEAKKEVK